MHLCWKPNPSSTRHWPPSIPCPSKTTLTEAPTGVPPAQVWAPRALFLSCPKACNPQHSDCFLRVMTLEIPLQLIPGKKLHGSCVPLTLQCIKNKLTYLHSYSPTTWYKNSKDIITHWHLLSPSPSQSCPCSHGVTEGWILNTAGSFVLQVLHSTW